VSTSTTETNTRPVFDLFQGYAISSVLASLQMTGLLPELAEGGLTKDKITDGDSAKLLTASLRYLATRGLVREEPDAFTLTGYGAEVFRDVGYLVWLVGGYGEPLRRVDAFLEGSKRYGDDYPRDGRWVADGSAVIGKTDVVPDALDLLGRHEFHTVLDLGCGNARFLSTVCERFGSNGIGVDLSPAACVEAEKVIGELGMRGQVRVEVGDAGELDRIPGLEEVDLVVAFFLLHEILANGRDVLVEYLKKMSKQLPPEASFLIAEVEPPTSEGQYFTPEFTYIHAIMRQFLYTAEDWTSALSEGGFAIKEVVRCGMPGGILLLCQNQA
jgi:ubiquinone/menaquinone biosynthesis C-methylase UbiE